MWHLRIGVAETAGATRWRTGVGKRDGDTTHKFIADLCSRVLGSPQIEAFGDSVHYRQIIKSYKGEPPVTAACRCSWRWVPESYGLSPHYLVVMKRQDAPKSYARTRFALALYLCGMTITNIVQPAIAETVISFRRLPPVAAVARLTLRSSPRTSHRCRCPMARRRCSISATSA
jgi:hypothetical protein